MNNQPHIIESVYQVILDRRNNPSESSYTAALMHKGVDAILKKIGEEATEVVIAVKGGKRDEIVCETTDLVFHLLVMLGHHDIPPDDIFDELRRRFGVSGLVEKASRTTT